VRERALTFDNTSFNSALKEVGDVQNWAKAVENDMVIVANALDAMRSPASPHVHTTQ
jgi:hypothetical protein